MANDALNYFHLTRELNDMLAGGRINKITMPEKDEIVLTVHAHKETYQLLLSACANAPRCHITHAKRDNPLVAPAFLMHLRKNIGSGQIVSITNERGERIVTINISVYNELAVEEHKRLIVEIMGKYSNIILVGENGNISESIKHVTPNLSSKRIVLPGIKYESAPKQDKTDIYDSALIAQIASFGGGDVIDFLMSCVSGFAPSTVRNAIIDAFGATEFEYIDHDTAQKIAHTLQSLYEDRLSPCIIRSSQGIVDFCYKPYVCDKEILLTSTLSEAMDAYYDSKDRADHFKDKTRRLQQIIRNAIQRTEKKLNGFLEKNRQCSDLDQDRLRGELLTANMYMVKQGMRSIIVDNYYDGSKTTIALDENKSPQSNAQSYFSKYNKKKKTLAANEEQIRKAQEDLETYQSVEASFRTASSALELEEIITELISLGLITQTASKNKKNKKTESSAPRQISYQGFNIIIGKNNMQNDRITKSAKPSDIWLHTQKIHGSHVIIVSDGREVPTDVIIRAAELAAYYSKAYLSSNVPVDYCPACNVSKPSGAPYGKVIYTGQSTVYVNPRSAE